MGEGEAKDRSAIAVFVEYSKKLVSLMGRAELRARFQQRLAAAVEMTRGQLSPEGVLEVAALLQARGDAASALAALREQYGDGGDGESAPAVLLRASILARAGEPAGALVAFAKYWVLLAESEGPPSTAE